jgi:predicted chitinase
MPRYGIITQKQQAAFLATCAYESQYFQKTKEGLARKGTKARAYQDKYWSTGYYGRGLIK